MDFDDEVGQWQRRMADGREGRARRLAVFDALSPKSGQSFLDIGCGGGHLVLDLALAVGQKGKVVGLDASGDQVEAAKSHCGSVPAIDLLQGNATALDFADNSFDGVASIQTLEYIADVDTVLSEARRVLKPAGKVAFVSVLWEHWRFYGADEALNNRMHALWHGHCPHRMLPFEMRGKLENQGFAAVQQTPIGFINNTMHENAFATYAAKLVVRMAKAKGASEEEAGTWLQQLKQADREGRFGFASVPVLTTAVAC